MKSSEGFYIMVVFYKKMVVLYKKHLLLNSIMNLAMKINIKEEVFNG